MGNYTESRYEIILGRYLLTDFKIDIKFSGYAIVGGVGLYKGYTAPMANLNYYKFDPSNGKTKIKPNEYLMETYPDECFGSEDRCDSTKIVHKILNTKYEKLDLNKDMNDQCQHLMENLHKDIITLIL